MITDFHGTKAKINPTHDRPQASPHKFTMTSLTSVMFFHPMMAHIFNNAGPHYTQDHIITQELFKRSSVEFSTGKQSRSELQEWLLAQNSSPLLLTYLLLTILSFESCSAYF